MANRPSAKEPCSNSDLEYLEAAFKMIDENHDGLIDATDLDKLLKRLNMAASQTQLQEMIAAHRDHSSRAPPGTINYAEFCIMMKRSGLRNTLDAAETRQIFTTIDKNKDGRISKDEMRDFMQAVNIKVTNAEVDEMYKTADTDKDGYISFEDFAEMVKLLEREERKQME